MYTHVSHHFPIPSLRHFPILACVTPYFTSNKIHSKDIDAAGFAGEGRGSDGSDGTASMSVWCNWSEDPEILQALLREFRGTGAGNSADDNEASTERRVKEGTEEGEETGAGVAKIWEGEEEEEEIDIGERSDIHMHLSEVMLLHHIFVATYGKAVTM